MSRILTLILTPIQEKMPPRHPVQAAPPTEMSMSSRINVRIRDKLFRHLVGLELGYYDVTPTGDLNSRLASDTSKVGDQVSLNVNVFARTAVQLATTLAFMVHTSPPLSLVACCAVPVIGVATKRYGKLVWGLSKKMQNELAGAMRVAEEAFSSCLLYTSPSPRDQRGSRMPSSA